jgi:hypothetical protein
MLLEVPDQLLGALNALVASPSLSLQAAIRTDRRNEPAIDPSKVESALRQLAERISPPIDRANLPSPEEADALADEREVLRMMRDQERIRYFRQTGQIAPLEHTWEAESDLGLVTPNEVKAAVRVMSNRSDLSFAAALKAVRARARR